MKCEKCNREHNGTFGSGRFCSRSCANAIGSKFVDYSTANVARRANVIVRCDRCGVTLRRTRKYGLCNACLRSSVSYRSRLSSAMKGKTGGYRKNSGRGKTGKYKGYTYQSSWELAWIFYNLEHGIQFERCKESFPYLYDNAWHRYYPDFKIGDTYIEVNGYNSPNKFAKFSYFPKDKKLVVITRVEIEPYLKYFKLHF